MSFLHNTRARFFDLFASKPAQHSRLQVQIVNETRKTVLAANAEVADTPQRRSKGLLGRDGLDPGEALWIVPCESVHTFWMQFDLDLIYLDRRHRVVKIRTGVPPWRLSASLKAHSIIEFQAGALRDTGTLPGDQLAFVPVLSAQSGTSDAAQNQDKQQGPADSFRTK